MITKNCLLRKYRGVDQFRIHVLVGLLAVTAAAPWFLALNTSAMDYASTDWVPLLDAKLSHWELWMGVPLQSVKGLPAGTITSTNPYDGIPLGLNNDPKHVFSVRMEAGEPVLCISGEIFGGLTTLETYSNYDFRCEFKWGEKKWEPKLGAPRDNGILFDCTGPHGAMWNVWKRSFEFQVEEKNMGDLYLLEGTCATVPLVKVNDEPFGHFDPSAALKPVGRIAHSEGGKVSHLPGDFERPNVEWNSLELYTIGRTAVFVVNGKVVNVLRDLAIGATPDQAPMPLSAGQLQIQSEGAECYYRRIEIRSITNYPDAIRSAAGLDRPVGSGGQ